MGCVESKSVARSDSHTDAHGTGSGGDAPPVCALCRAEVVAGACARGPYCGHMLHPACFQALRTSDMPQCPTCAHSLLLRQERVARIAAARNAVEKKPAPIDPALVPRPALAVSADDDCAVCQEPAASAASCELPCRHVFHTECATSWLRRHRSCPLCRAPAHPPTEVDEQPPAAVAPVMAHLVAVAPGTPRVPHAEAVQSPVQALAVEV